MKCSPRLTFARTMKSPWFSQPSTSPDPRPGIDWRKWTEMKSRFFGFHRDLPSAAAAQILGGHVVFSEQRQGQWIAVIEMERAVEARARAASRLEARFPQPTSR